MRASAGRRGRARRTAAGSLYVVATPIGNLGDVTMRALEVLRSVDLIAAEDTRHTRRLLDRYEIAARLVSYHARNASAREGELLARLAAGADIALVTDAGTPGVSDPGADLVRAWAEQGGKVVPVPGPSAALAALSATGIAGPRWSFEGFLPRSGRERRERLARLGGDERGSVVFEAPGRLAATLRDLSAACGGDRVAAVCRELTKLHEQILRGSLAELAAAAAAGEIDSRGEVVIVIGERRDAPKADDAKVGSTADELAAALAEVERLVAAGTARGEAARRVADATGLPRRRLYSVDRQAGRPDLNRDQGRQRVSPRPRPTRSNSVYRSRISGGRRGEERPPPIARKRWSCGGSVRPDGQAATSSPSGIGSSARTTGASDSPRVAAWASSEWAAASAS